MTKTQKRMLLAIVLPIQVVLAVLGWRDLDGRADDEVRGGKRLWRVLILLNPGNSMLYWTVGRRRITPAT